MNGPAPAALNLGRLSVLYFNARSIFPKIEELRALCLTHHPDLVCIVESWLDNSILDSELCIDNYDIVRLDRNRHGGGVMFFVISSLSHSLVFSGSENLELIVISLNLPQTKVCVGLFYRPPNAPTCIFDNILSTLCTYVDVSLFSNFIFLGDFNVNVLNPSHPSFCKLHFLASSLCLTQIVSEPTHVTSNSHSLIDLIFMSSPSSLINCSTVPALANSDHLDSVTFIYSWPCPGPTKKIP